MPQPDDVQPHTPQGRVWIITESREEAWANGLQDYLRARGHRVGTYPLVEALGRVAVESLSGNLERLRKLVPLFGPNGASNVVDELSEHPPQLVVTRSPDAARGFQSLRQVVGGTFAVLALVDDFEVPTGWLDVRPDFAVAPSGEQLEWMGFGDAEPTRRIVAGPFAPFARPLPETRETVRRSLGADDHRMVVLIDASRLAPTLIDQVMYQVGLLGTGHPSLQILFYYGSHEDSATTLRDAARARRVHARMFGASMPLEKVLPGVDLVVVGEHSDVLLASVFLGIPLIALNANAPQHVLAQHGAMVPLAHHASLATLLQEISSQGIASAHQDAAAALAQLVQDEDVYEAVERLLTHAEALPDPRFKRTAAPADAFAFEEIGSDHRRVTVSRDAALTPQAAREALSRLLLEQRRLEKLHETAVTQRDLWLVRLGDAEAENEAELQAFADEMVQRCFKEVADLQRQLDEVLDAKEELRRQVSGGGRRSAETLAAPSNTPAMMEKRFLEMASRRQLRDLRDRAQKKGPNDA